MGRIRRSLWQDWWSSSHHNVRIRICKVQADKNISAARHVKWRKAIKQQRTCLKALLSSLIMYTVLRSNALVYSDRTTPNNTTSHSGIKEAPLPKMLNNLQPRPRLFLQLLLHHPLPQRHHAASLLRVPPMHDACNAEARSVHPLFWVPLDIFLGMLG